MRIGESVCPIFWGMRFVVAREGFDEESDPRVCAAKQHDLDVWVGQCQAGTEDDEVDEGTLFVLIGCQLAILGPDYTCSHSIAERRLVELMGQTRERLIRAGFSGEPALWMQCETEYGN